MTTHFTNMALLGGARGDQIDELAAMAEAIDCRVVQAVGKRLLVTFADPFSGIRLVGDVGEAFDKCRAALHTGRLGVTSGGGDQAAVWGPGYDQLCRMVEVARPAQILVTDAFRQELAVDDAVGVHLFDFGARRLDLALDEVHIFALSLGDHDAIPSLDLGETTLPVLERCFMGRVDDLREVESRLDQARVVTVTGPGGIGKTQLAVQVGHRRRRRRPSDNVWFVDLSAARDLSDAVAILNNALELHLESQASAAEVFDRVGKTLSAVGPSLVILDNVDQITDVVEEGLRELAPRAENVDWLLTSRRAVGGFADEIVDLGPLAQGVAVQLLVERVQVSRPGFRLTEQSFEEAVAIVDHLDHIPLAIELTAARAQFKGLRTLCERCLSRPAIGADGGDPAAALDEVVAASWRLLTEHQRDILTHCTAFAGPFSVEMASQLVDIDGVEGVLGELVEHSLLGQFELPAAAGDVGLRVLVPVAQFVRRHSEATTLEQALDRHLELYVEHARAWCRACRGPDQIDTLERLSFEANNLRAAFRRALGRRLPDAATLALALHDLYAVRGPFEQDRTMLLEVLELVEEADLGDARVDIYLAIASISGTCNRVEESRAYAQRAFDALDDHADPGTRITALRLVGRNALLVGEFERAKEALDEALELAERLDARGELALALYEQSGHLVDAGRLDEALELTGRAVTYAVEHGNPLIRAMVYGLRGLATQTAGRFDESERASGRALELFSRLGMRRAEALTLIDLADVAFERGDVHAAKAACARAIRTARHAGAFFAAAAARASLGFIYIRNFDAAKARRHLCEVLNDLDSDAYVMMRAMVVTLLGAVEIFEERPQAARRRFEQADGLLEDFAASPWYRSLQLFRILLGVAGKGTPKALAEAQKELEAHILDEHDHSFVRQTYTLVQRYLERAKAASAEPGAALALVVGPDARWFVPPGEARVDISRRSAPRHILDRLADQRAEHPGEPLNLDTLVEVGWPDQTLHPTSAKNRLHVAIATLRDLGLRDLLITQGHGYMLDTSVPIRRAT